MKPTAILTAALILTAGTAISGEKIDTLCGAGHVNEVSSDGDVTENPNGYYIRSMQVQLSHGDPRLVLGVGDEYRLCTRPAATPDMEANRARLLVNERAVKYLFVPFAPRPKRGS